MACSQIQGTQNLLIETYTSPNTTSEQSISHKLQTQTSMHTYCSSCILKHHVKPLLPIFFLPLIHGLCWRSFHLFFVCFSLGKYLRQKRIDFQLPYDILWLWKHDQVMSLVKPLRMYLQRRSSLLPPLCSPHVL